MTQQTWLERTGATPGKLAAVGTLTVLLVAVIWHNTTGSGSPADMEATRPTTPPQQVATKTPAPAQPAPAKPGLSAKAPRTWPRYQLEKVTKHDPLAKPMWYLVAQAAETGTTGASLARSAKVLDELRKQRTKIVVIAGDERIATIGDLSFRVGDTIEGFQVTEITTDGIVLTELGR